MLSSGTIDSMAETTRSEQKPRTLRDEIEKAKLSVADAIFRAADRGDGPGALALAQALATLTGSRSL